MSNLYALTWGDVHFGAQTEKSNMQHHPQA